LLKQIHYVVIGVPASVIIFLVIVFFAGICLITYCETEIEIISYNTSELVYVGDKMRAEFTIKNKGGVMAENCVLKWSLARMQDTVSKTFQLPALEEIKIELLSIEEAPFPRDAVSEVEEKLLGSTNEMVSRAWVSCDNTESPKVQSAIKLKIPRNP